MDAEINACCKDLSNRKVVEQKKVEGPTGTAVATKTQCVVCLRHHYVLEVPPVPVGISGAEMG